MVSILSTVSTPATLRKHDVREGAADIDRERIRHWRYDLQPNVPEMRAAILEYRGDLGASPKCRWNELFGADDGEWRLTDACRDGCGTWMPPAVLTPLITSSGAVAADGARGWALERRGRVSWDR